MIGIGGIGMSALAQLYFDQGYTVSGSDREESPTTTLLTKKGITVHLTQTGEYIQDNVSFAVYSEAVGEDNPERMKVKELGITEYSYFEALGEVTRTKRTIAVSGTHGKTTTAAMLTKLLVDAGVSPTAIIGSLVKDFGSNYVKGEGEWFVVEACEYKRDFLTLHPEILVITNLELDHTDYYKDLADVQDAFSTLIAQTKGTIVTNVSHKNIAPLVTGREVIDYTKEKETPLSLPGVFNKENAKAAAAAAKVVKEMNDEEVQRSLETFQGTWRRFDKKGVTVNGALVYDDYAHHPTAVKATLEEMKKLTKGKLYVAFHPHLYSRTKDLLSEFSSAFSSADQVYVAPIYAAREIDDGSISSEILAEKIREQGTLAQAKTFEEIQEAFETLPQEGDVIVTMGAGDIYKVGDNIV